MSRRLACLSIPDFPMQAFLFEQPQWRDNAVVLLDRDEANGRILAMNDQAAKLGLGRGMMYGPCLGIHRNLKAGVVDEGRLADWRERVETLLLRFSPSVERSDFSEGVWWLDASGLGALFPSVRPWLEQIRETITGLGLNCSAAAGHGRFSTWAAALSAASGPVSLFADRNAEKVWFDGVPVSLFSLKADTRRLMERLKITTMESLLKIPLPDIRRRLDGDIAAMVTFIRREERLPLQAISLPEPVEWSFPLEDPVISAGPLCYVADRLIGRCREHARRLGQQVRSMRFIFEGGEASRELTIRPARPTRDENMLSRLFASRLEYVDLEDPVRGLRCIGFFSGAVTPQGSLFGADTCRRRHDAQKVLSYLQAERGEDSVQYSRVLKNPLPMRCFELSDWKGFRRGSGRGTGDTEGVSSPSGPSPLVRRIVLDPRPLSGGLRIISRVAYSGNWWDRPYSYQMAWAESRGQTCWLSSDTGSRDWKLIGWLD